MVRELLRIVIGLCTWYRALKSFKYSSKDAALDGAALEPSPNAVTDHVTDEYKRPPWPYDSAPSSVRFKQGPIVEGAAIITVGAVGLLGADIVSEDSIAVGFEEHESVLRVQNARSNLSFKVTVPPGTARSALLRPVVTTGNSTLTRFESSQTHVDKEAPTKLKSVLHAQLAPLIPA